jgi:hypothetical protein
MRLGTLKLVNVAYMHFITLVGVVCRVFQQMAKYVTSNGNPSENGRPRHGWRILKWILNNGGYMDRINFITGHRPATSWVHYTTYCNTQSSAPEDG